MIRWLISFIVGLFYAEEFKREDMTGPHIFDDREEGTKT